MKLFKLSILIVGFVFMLQSCNNDSDVDENQNEVTPSFSSYKTISSSNYTDSNSSLHNTYESVMTTNIVNNKLSSSMNEVFVNGISQGITTFDYFTYNNGLVISDSDGVNSKDFFYNATNDLIGLNWNRVGNGSVDVMHYRYVYVSTSIVYLERIDLPYDNPQAVILKRSILKFDENDNVVEAGVDFDLNGQMDSVNQFTYLNGNMVAIHKGNGQVLNFQFSNVIDNLLFLKDNSYGKKMHRLINAECFSVVANDSYFSKNLLQQNVNEEVYEVLSNGFYKKKTKTITFSDPVYTANNTTTTEFFFN
ncbi:MULTISPECIES: hypothetical protein [Flavobacterium]|uniref:Nicotinic acid mononucleotide adenyltransferase n=1 Tax=Flavobacterium hankyongi TaxID=1176532 RepID=A0ABP8ZWC5_9FLAO|nr:hypothetical protein [Flavobacterium sp. N1846]